MIDEKLFQLAEELGVRSRNMIQKIMVDNGMTQEEIKDVFDNLPEVQIFTCC